MRRFILSLFIAILWLNGPVVYGATSMELQAQITALLNQVQALQAQLQTSKEAVILTFNFRRGSTDSATNGEVSNLQQFLAQDRTIYPEALVTGYFGLLTDAAVKRFQTQNGIASIGIVGPQTREAIKRLSIPPAVTSATVTTTPTPPPAGGSTSTTPPTPAPPPVAPSLGSITLSPFSGMVHDTVTITGTGFTPANNDIHFGRGGISNIKSFNDGTMITFEIPSEVSPCDLIPTSTTSCLDPDVAVTPGSYTLYVTNANGSTATTTFTITSGVSYPSIITVSPSLGRVGTTITITGSGLELTDNEVHLGVGGIRVNTQRKVKGTLLDFTVPASVNDCDFNTGLPPCTGKTYQIVPGYYALYIVNSNGKTNSVTFTVTAY